MLSSSSCSCFSSPSCLFVPASPPPSSRVWLFVAIVDFVFVAYSYDVVVVFVGSCFSSFSFCCCCVSCLFLFSMSMSSFSWVRASCFSSFSLFFCVCSFLVRTRQALLLHARAGRRCSHQRLGHCRAADCRVVPDVPRHRGPQEILHLHDDHLADCGPGIEGSLERARELHVHPPDEHTQRNTESTLGADSVSNLLLKMAS